MTAFLSILKLTWPYVLCAIVAGYLAHRVVDGPSYSRLETTLASERAQRADERAQAQKSATDALQAQIQTRLQTEAHNGKVIAQLQAERDSAAADRDFARRLLAAAQARPAASRAPVSAAAGGPAAHGATQPPGSGSLVTDLGDAADECRDAIQRLAALQVELQPQLKATP